MARLAGTCLAALQAEWNSSRPLPMRRLNLTSGSGPILQGQGLKLQAGATLLHDAEIDALFGGADLDWFLLDPVRDQAKDKTLSEPLV